MTNAFATRQRSQREATLSAVRSQIQALYEENFTDQEIADRLRLNGNPVDRSYVTKVRNAMGLPPRWGRKNGYVFNAKIDADLIDLKTHTRLSWKQIELIIAFPANVLYARHQLLTSMALHQGETRETKRKKCMLCPEHFMTDQPRQEHMCEACRKRIETTGASFDDYL